MEGILEQQRALHEERERLVETMAQEMVKGETSKSTYRQQLNSGHRIKIMQDRHTEVCGRLADLYEDKDNLRRQDIAALTNGPFNEFYNRLRGLREYYRKHPEEVSVPLSVQVAAFSRLGLGNTPSRQAAAGGEGSAEPEEELLVSFSDEEAHGRFLDLHLLYEKFLNLKGIVPPNFSYHDYLKGFFRLDEVPRDSKNTAAYRQYVEAVFEYLADFLFRTKPLTDIRAELDNVEKDVDSKWSKGQVPGWGKGLQSAQSANQGVLLDLRSFSAVEEIMELGMERLKSALMALGMKCGGTLEERAKRLWSTRGKSPAEIDASLLVAKPSTAQKNQEDSRQKELAVLEAKVMHLATLVEQERKLTEENVVRKQARAGQEREEEEDDVVNDEEDEEDDDEVIYNPKNLPLGWDGKPIPYWLYKLHGLNINYPCEICGNQVYRGPKAFQRHFSEWRHAHGMRCLGIPNTAHFANITHIEEAVKLWEKLKKAKNADKWKPDAEEEFEDSAGNVVNRKTYEDLRRQGLL
ncbi:splicing factor 3A subunit 3-like [Paramacrobiotus metropolitanus]|uniref:splicing factor 3A subunit 3-like n=1 Tax=Paramacrobiotus metropolitanus TaxID=2943436 RepID=UPI0024459866|nr:splicing factor 3A subunit 3-like [Paramacrobiotus metropolitanus]